MVRASFSRCNEFSLTFARGLRRWLPAAVRLDLLFPQRWQYALAADLLLDLIAMAASAGSEKP
jgi:hypothetical protein